MEFEDIPPELLVPPEERLVGTLLTRAPNPMSFPVNVLVCGLISFITYLYWIDFLKLSEFLPAINFNIFSQLEIWRAFTAILIHQDIAHLLSNLYMLGIFGFFVYGYFGGRLYLLWSFLGAGLVNFIAVYTYPPHVRLLGASGWVYLLGGFWLVMYLLIQRQFSVPRRLMRVMGMALMVFFPTSFEPTTSYRTHFIGFMVGAGLAAVFFLWHRNRIQALEIHKTIH